MTPMSMRALVGTTPERPIGGSPAWPRRAMLLRRAVGFGLAVLLGTGAVALGNEGLVTRPAPPPAVQAGP